MYLISTTAIVVSPIEADSAEAAADRWLAWRARHHSVIRLPGGPRLFLTFDTDPTVLDEGGHRLLTIDRATRRGERVSSEQKGT